MMDLQHQFMSAMMRRKRRLAAGADIDWDAVTAPGRQDFDLTGRKRYIDVTLTEYGGHTAWKLKVVLAFSYGQAALRWKFQNDSVWHASGDTVQTGLTSGAWSVVVYAVSPTASSYDSWTLQLGTVTVEPDMFSPGDTCVATVTASLLKQSEGGTGGSAATQVALSGLPSGVSLDGTYYSYPWRSQNSYGGPKFKEYPDGQYGTTTELRSPYSGSPYYYVSTSTSREDAASTSFNVSFPEYGSVTEVTDGYSFTGGTWYSSTGPDPDTGDPGTSESGSGVSGTWLWLYWTPSVALSYEGTGGVSGSVARLWDLFAQWDPQTNRWYHVDWTITPRALFHAPLAKADETNLYATLVDRGNLSYTSRQGVKCALTGSSPTATAQGTAGRTLTAMTFSCHAYIPDAQTIDPYGYGMVQLTFLEDFDWDSYSSFGVSCDSTFRYWTVGSTYLSLSAAALTYGAWHHIAVVADSSGCVLYVDGEAKGSTSTALSSRTVSANGFRAFYSEMNGYMPAGVYVADMMLFDVALTPMACRLLWRGLRPVTDAAVTVTVPEGRRWYADDDAETTYASGASARLSEGRHVIQGVPYASGGDTMVTWRQITVSGAQDQSVALDAYHAQSAYPEIGLSFHAPLSASAATAATGQALTETGSPVFGSVSGLPCATFDGTNRIDFSTAGLSLALAPRAMSLWVNPTTTGGNPGTTGQTIAHVRRSADGASYGIILRSDARFSVWGGTPGNVQDIYTDSGVTYARRWQHIAISYDGSVMSFWHNGTLVKSASMTMLATTGAPDTGRIGWWEENGANLVGSVASVRIYERALSATDVASLYSEHSAVLTGSLTVTVPGSRQWYLNGDDTALHSSGQTVTVPSGEHAVYGVSYTSGGKTYRASAVVDVAGASTTSVTLEYRQGGSYPATTKDGTLANPYAWEDYIDSSNYQNECHTVTFSTQSLASYRAHFYVYLEAGTSYSMGMTGGGDTYLRLFDLSGTQVAYDDESAGTVDGVSTRSTISHTPSASGWFKLCACYYNDNFYITDAALHVYPAPVEPVGEQSSSAQSSSSGQQSSSSSSQSGGHTVLYTVSGFTGANAAYNGGYWDTGETSYRDGIVYQNANGKYLYCMDSAMVPQYGWADAVDEYFSMSQLMWDEFGATLVTGTHTVGGDTVTVASA